MEKANRPRYRSDLQFSYSLTSRSRTPLQQKVILGELCGIHPNFKVGSAIAIHIA
jgi:hypothetical protein